MEGFWDSILQWGRDNLTDWTLVKVYIACAVAGGTVLLAQTGLNLFGLGGDTDIDADVDVDDLDVGGGSLNFLSIRALAGFLTFFGLVGWGGTAAGWSQTIALPVAFVAGSSVMFVVAWIMRFFVRLQSRGNLEPESVVGQAARVYLKIPAERGGKGKITVSIQGRSHEFDALTAGAELPSGSECRIVKQTTDNTFEVAPLE